MEVELRGNPRDARRHVGHVGTIDGLRVFVSLRVSPKSIWVVRGGVMLELDDPGFGKPNLD